MIDALKSQLKELSQEDGFHFIEKKHNYRFERKFTVPDSYSFTEIEHVVHTNRFLFREVFHERQVNNIYFDTLGFTDYFDNVLGVANRKKIRIRWYGDTFGEIAKPVLEIKIKKGLVGDKWSYKLKPFTLNNDFTNSYIQSIFEASDLPASILESVKMVTPTLLNSYSRRYFLSANNKYRVTLDYSLLYHRIDKRFNNFKRQPETDPNKIVELKYALEDDDMANQISTMFPFRLNKNSKYVNGVNTIKQFPQ
ncbi:MAG: VTC domain-containing protein [Bacteroidia bacterium]|nr:VTC domain-containing protein [Bacteroidia bacterium]NND25719.1 VTC domain-containing protein [Flavobacteriaceae bacterium]MBT8279215.1 VTC domain-containing protein [Bacteroidia bacterium]NNK59751.1 VTC domain-containing protein [Flavobacteriaceae bacterium]NNL32015.1 VTC domain-containing protein [Flavobacteriaceae bacterium]